MTGFIEAGHENLEPLMDFRDWLTEIRSDADRRMAVRRSGRVTHLADGSLVPGPFTLAARREILEELLRVQAAVNRELITQAEIDLINTIWAQDAGSAVGRGQAAA